MKKILLTALLFAVPAALSAADIPLPPPDRHGGMPLMQALSVRRTARDFSDREVSLQTLSSLLWAANGINRPADGRRTAPTGYNVQDIDVYVMLPAGVYRYDAPAHALRLVNPGDHRSAAGRQPFACAARLNLFYVQDRARAMKAEEPDASRYAGLHAGAVMQNVYLFCAKEGLATVARAYLDYDACAAALKLSATQRVVLGQTVGYPPADGMIGRQAAIRAALAHAQVAEQAARRLTCELDREDGRMVYEVDFKHGGFEFDYEIDARTGSIVKAKRERD
jgi:SagB-type dehydrogenase family enzyme